MQGYGMSYYVFKEIQASQCPENGALVMVRRIRQYHKLGSGNWMQRQEPFSERCHIHKAGMSHRQSLRGLLRHLLESVYSYSSTGSLLRSCLLRIPSLPKAIPTTLNELGFEVLGYLLCKF